jgi:single-strand DNA-binding protein
MAEDINGFYLCGRLVADSEFREFGNNGKELKFSIASTTGYGEYEHSNYFDCRMWGRAAESLGQYLVKGKAVLVKGYMKQERWEAQDGSKRSRVVLQVEKLQFLSSGESRGNSTAPPRDNYKPPQAPRVEEYDDDIPF